MNLSVGVATYSSISYHSIFQNMTDNGVDMVGGDSSNQGQVRNLLSLILGFNVSISSNVTFS